MFLLVKIRYLLMVLLITAGPITASATQDVETASEKLGYLRNLLSDNRFVTELHDITSQGFTWKKEIFWLGAPQKLEDLNNRNALRKGGVEIVFENKSGEKIWLKFTFLSNSKNYSIKDLQRK